MASAQLRSSLPIIDQHSVGGKLLQQAVQDKLKEYMGADYDDEVLPLYIVVMLSHGNPEQLVAENLDAFLGTNSSKFAAWLFAHVAEAALYTAEKPAIVPQPHQASANLEEDAVMEEGLSDVGGSGKAAWDAARGEEERSAPDQDKMRFEDRKVQERAGQQERERERWPQDTNTEQYHDQLQRPLKDRESSGVDPDRVKSSVTPGQHFRAHAIRRERDYNGRHGDGSQLLDRRRPNLRSRSRSPPRRYHRQPYEAREWIAEPWHQRPYGAGPRDRSDQGHYPPPGMQAPPLRESYNNDDNQPREHSAEGRRRGGSGWRRQQDFIRQPEQDVRWGVDLPDEAMLESSHQASRQHISTSNGYGVSLVPPAVDFEAKARDVGGLYRAPSRLIMSAVRRSTSTAEATASQPVPEPVRYIPEEAHLHTQPASVFERLSESALTRSGAHVVTSNRPSVQQPGVRSVWERMQNGSIPDSASGPDQPTPSPSAEELALLGLQQAMASIKTELSDMRRAAWRQHEAQPQINKLRSRTGTARAAVSVAVSNLHFRASESVVAAHFSVIGPVVRVTIPNKRTGRGFVEFADAVAAQSALALSGSILMQRPITVKAPVAQQLRNKLQSAVWTRSIPLPRSK